MTKVYELLEGIAEAARMNLKQSGGVLPVFLVGRGTEVIVPIGAMFRNAQEKDKVASYVQKVCHDVDADFVIFVSESYSYIGADAEKMYAKYGSVEKIPNRKEVVTIQYESNGVVIGGIAEIVMIDGIKTCGKMTWQKMEKGGGRFSDLLPKRVVH